MSRRSPAGRIPGAAPSGGSTQFAYRKFSVSGFTATTRSDLVWSAGTANGVSLSLDGGDASHLVADEDCWLILAFEFDPNAAPDDAAQFELLLWDASADIWNRGMFVGNSYQDWKVDVTGDSPGPLTFPPIQMLAGEFVQFQGLVDAGTCSVALHVTRIA